MAELRVVEDHDGAGARSTVQVALGVAGVAIAAGVSTASVVAWKRGDMEDSALSQVCVRAFVSVCRCR
jgi:hypothetical protein